MCCNSSKVAVQGVESGARCRVPLIEADIDLFAYREMRYQGYNLLPEVRE